MNILGFDTSTGILSIELRFGKQKLYSVRDIGLRHSETLLELGARILQDAGAAASDIDLFACAGGPGSFTGLRIGMSTVKGLAAGTGKPFVIVPTLDLYAYGFESFQGTVVSLIDARKKRYYAALYRNGKKLSQDLDVTPDELLSLLPRDDAVLLTGPDAEAFAASHEAAADFRLYPLAARGNPGALLTLAEKHYREQGPSPSDASPVYIRKSEAELSSNGNGADETR